MTRTAYKGFEIETNRGQVQIIDNNGSGHCETSIEAAKLTIDDWIECDRPTLGELLPIDIAKERCNPLGF